MRVLLVCMPFAAATQPPLGVSLLKAGLAARGVTCDIAYPNLSCAELLGADDYLRLSNGLPFQTMAGDWVFAECMFGSDQTSARAYVDDILRGRWHLEQVDVDTVERARSLSARLLQDIFGSVDWPRYRLVGFTSSFAQNVASLALARMIKEQHPDVLTVFGGANLSEGMGTELHRCFPFVDFVCSGEADVSLPQLVEYLEGGRPDSLRSIPGLVYRDHGATRSTRAAMVENLDALPVPDYKDFFRALRDNRGALRSLPAIQVETSRGCLWAARSPCLFCGLNGPARTYREKSTGRVLCEMRELARLWPSSLLGITDNVVPPAFFSQVLPDLADRRLPTPLFVEVRPDVGRDEIALLGKARASVQPGIESLNDHVLRLIHKGARALENIRLLKWAKSSGVKVYWNLLFGIPGGLEQDYEEMRAMVPALRFLPPPDSCSTLRLDRFSCYFEDPGRHGFCNVRPGAAYRYVYSLPESSLRRIAGWFDYDYQPGFEPPAAADRLREEVESWRRDGAAGDVRAALKGDGTLAITDLRPGAVVRRHRLDALDTLLYRSCEDIGSRQELLRCAQAELPEVAGLDAEVDRRLARLVKHRLMVGAGDRFLSLADSRPEPAIAPPATART
jgi:ribosomal peptide maturation radical SAM protein 1